MTEWPDDLAERQAANIEWQRNLIGAQGDELADLLELTSDVFADDVPLRDRIAVLVAQWQDAAWFFSPFMPLFVQMQDVSGVIRERAGL